MLFKYLFSVAALAATALSQDAKLAPRQDADGELVKLPLNCQ
jgi:hypothetical protein